MCPYTIASLTKMVFKNNYWNGLLSLQILIIYKLVAIIKRLIDENGKQYANTEKLWGVIKTAASNSRMLSNLVFVLQSFQVRYFLLFRKVLCESGAPVHKV